MSLILLPLQSYPNPNSLTKKVIVRVRFLFYQKVLCERDYSEQINEQRQGIIVAMGILPFCAIGMIIKAKGLYTCSGRMRRNEREPL